MMSPQNRHDEQQPPPPPPYLLCPPTSCIDGGCIVVVAKCPVAGQCKTRLNALLGEKGSAQLAKAMLCDILTTIGNCEALDKVKKILLFAPSDDQGRSHMSMILQELNLHEQQQQSEEVYNDDGGGWTLMPMLRQDLGSSNLSHILADALHRVRYLQQQPQHSSYGVMFLGMDAPELPMDEIITAFQVTQCFDNASTTTTSTATTSTAMMCPAADGGYGMLCVPSCANADLIFQDVLWSHPLTAVSQIKALTDSNLVVKLGRLMHDVDEPDDVQQLCQRLQQPIQQQHHPHDNNPHHDQIRNNGSVLGILETSSNKTLNRLDGPCHYTRQALVDLGLL